MDIRECHCGFGVDDVLRKSKTTNMSTERRNVQEAVLLGKQKTEISSFTDILVIPARSDSPFGLLIFRLYVMDSSE